LFVTRLYRARITPPRDLEGTCLAIAAEDRAGQRWSREHGYGGYTSYASLNDLPQRASLFADLEKAIAKQVAGFARELQFELGGRKLKLDSMWVNVMDAGGRQAMHNHANSFISGVVYLTPTHPGSQTVFMKSPGGTDFLLKNDHPGTTPNEFNSDKWISPAPEPGDMILFPSYLMHAVPPNQGERRITLSFNAIPVQLDSWGYVIRLS